MDRLARLHLQYLILDQMKAPRFLIRAAAERYNACLDEELDKLLPLPIETANKEG